MATGRTVKKHTEVYMGGFDITGYSMDIGDLGMVFAEAEGTAFNDEVIGAYPDQGDVQIGPLNGIFDNTATIGLHIVAKDAGVKRDIMVPIGIRAAAAEGDPVFSATVPQLTYQAQPTAGNLVAANIAFGNWALDAITLLYAQVWGDLAHEKSAETGVNSAVAVIDGAAQTALGGYMMYQVFTSNGTVAIKIQDSSVNSDGNFGDLATSGDVDASAAPKSGIIALGKTATVERYIRWQIALNTATTVTFALAFVRGR